MKAGVARLAGVMMLCGVGGCAFWGPSRPHVSSSVELYLKGQLQAERGDLDGALATLTKAIDKAPGLSLALEARGDLFKRKGDYERAAADFKHVTSIEPFNFNATYELGLMYQYLKRFTDAAAAYQKAVEIKPLDRDANMNLAVVYTQMGQPLQGLPYAQRALAGGDDAAAQANLGVLYMSAGYNDQAIQAFKRALELNSRMPDVYASLGQLYITMGQFEQAKGVLTTGQELGSSATVSERLGLACYKLKDYAGARAAFLNALRQDGSSLPALNGIGVVAMTESLNSNPPDLDAAREALAYWDRSLKIQPDQPAIQQLVNKYTGSK